jgi:hypothetical protein
LRGLPQRSGAQRNLSLEQFRDPAAALGHPEVWQKVLDKVSAGQMPPKPAAPLAGGDLAAVTGWIRKLPGVSDMSASTAPVNPWPRHGPPAQPDGIRQHDSGSSRGGRASGQ